MSQSAFHPESHLREEMRRSKTISFDIFDTLVTRIMLTPDAALRFAGQRNERLTGLRSSFFDIRKSAEVSARKRHGALGDVTLDEIYDEIGRMTGLAPSIVAECKITELETDFATMRPRSHMVDILKEAHESGKRVIIVSDTYYTRSTIDRILQYIDVSKHIDEVYISSERRARKDKGTMWDLITQSEDVSEMLHIGDNLHSDIKKSSEYSIKNFRIASGYDLFLHSKLSKPFKTLRIGSSDISHAILLGSLVERLFNNPFVAVDNVYKLNDLETAGFFLYGPVLMSFLSSIFSDEALMKKKRLLFLAREGYFLIRLYEDTANSIRLHVPEPVYFCCSRLVSLAASLESGLDTDLVLGQPGWFKGTMEQLLKVRFGFDTPHLPKLRDIAIRIPPRKLHRLMTWMPFFRNFMKFMGRSFPLDRRETAEYLQSLSSELSTMARKSKIEIISYAAVQGVDPQSAPSLAIIDVGYSATIQSSLQHALGVGFDGYYMATTSQARQVQAQGGSARAAFADGQRNSSFIKRYSLFIEAFLTAPHGQTIGYAEVGPLMEAVFRNPGTADDTMATLEGMFDGVMAYCRQLTGTFGEDVFKIIAGSTVSLCTIDMLKDGSVAVPTTVIDALEVENLFCGDESQKVAL